MKKIIVSIRMYFVNRKINKIAENIADINALMVWSGWERNKRREFWSGIIRVIKQHS